MTRLADQLEILKRIATFSAGVRGHELGEWRTSGNGARARCAQCGAELRVYFPVLEPAMDGPAMEHDCMLHAVAGRAA